MTCWSPISEEPNPSFSSGSRECASHLAFPGRPAVIGSWPRPHARGPVLPEETAKGYDLCVARDLLLANVSTGEVRTVKSGEPFLKVLRWKPDQDSFAYATRQVAYLESVDGQVTELANVPGDECPFCLDSLEWSPDGRYVILTDFWRTVAVLDTATGEVRKLVEEETEEVFIFPAFWWE